jgi:outer membrane protein OmpA-like peptidoglycan-associated protein
MTRPDRRKKFAFAAVLFALLLVTGILYRPGAMRSAPPAAAPASSVAALPAASAAAVPTPPPVERLGFATGSDRLPDGSMDVLNRIADAARIDPGTTVQVSAFYAGGGPTGADAQLAGRRGEAVRHALAANGVPLAQMRMIVVSTTDEASAAAGRVEVLLQ